MNGPGEATRQSAWQSATRLPRRRGKSRVSAAFQSYPGTGFRGGVVMGLYFLLPYKYPCKVQRTERPASSKGPKARVLGFFFLLG